MQTAIQTFARFVSIIGHPAVLPPAIVVMVLADKGSGVLPLATAMFVAVASIVMFYSYRKVRAGDWKHVDASVPKERQALNPLLAVALFLAALLAVRLPGAQALGLGLGAAGVIPVLAMLLSKWMKLSLHVAYAGFVAVWLSTVAPWLSAVGLLAALLVAWSRVVLRRHSFLEVYSGLMVGTGIGGALSFVLRTVAA